MVDEKELKGVEGGETVIRIHYVRRSLFKLKRRKENTCMQENINSGSVINYTHLLRTFSGLAMEIMCPGIDTALPQTNPNSGSLDWRRASSQLRMRLAF